MSLICSSSLLIGQPLLDTSNIEHVNVFDSDTTYNRNVTAFITYYNSIDSCINLFTSNNIQDYDTLFISEKENLIIYKYEKYRLLINYSNNNLEGLNCNRLLCGDTDNESFIIEVST